MMPQTVVQIGNNLKRLRTRRFLTQRALAKKAGVSPTTVYKVEKNEVEPHFSTILSLAEALEVDPNDLLED
jgi:transcriptional regulator with XRE-family HTH domain